MGTCELCREVIRVPPLPFYGFFGFTGLRGSSWFPILVCMVVLFACFVVCPLYADYVYIVDLAYVRKRAAYGSESTDSNTKLNDFFVITEFP